MKVLAEENSRRENTTNKLDSILKNEIGFMEFGENAAGVSLGFKKSPASLLLRHVQESEESSTSDEEETSINPSEGKLEIGFPKKDKHDLMIIKHPHPKSKWDLPKSWICRINSDGSETIIDELVFRNWEMQQRRLDILRRRNQDGDENQHSEDDEDEIRGVTGGYINSSDSDSDDDKPLLRNTGVKRQLIIEGGANDSEEEGAIGSDDELLSSSVRYSSIGRPMSALEDID